MEDESKLNIAGGRDLLPIVQRPRVPRLASGDAVHRDVWIGHGNTLGHELGVGGVLLLQDR